MAVRYTAYCLLLFMKFIESIVKFFHLPKSDPIRSGLPNIVVLISPRSVFIDGSNILCNVDANNEEHPWQDLSDEQKLQLIENGMPELKISLLDSLDLPYTPICFGIKEVYAYQHNYFSREFINSYLSKAWWSAGMALITLFEIQLRIILLGNGVISEDEADKTDLSSLNRVLFNDNEIKCIIEEITVLRGKFFAHTYPINLKSLDNSDRKLSKEIIKGETTKISEFYKNNFNQLIKTYCMFHKQMNPYYQQKIREHVDFANQRIVNLLAQKKKNASDQRS